MAGKQQVSNVTPQNDTSDLKDPFQRGKLRITAIAYRRLGCSPCGEQPGLSEVRNQCPDIAVGEKTARQR